MKVPVHHIHCDRCSEKIGQENVSPNEAEKEPPAYYRLISISGTSSAEKTLQHLCARCKREVELLDERIFSNVRAHKTADKSSEPEPTTTKSESKGAANA